VSETYPDLLAIRWIWKPGEKSEELDNKERMVLIVVALKKKNSPKHLQDKIHATNCISEAGDDDIPWNRVTIGGQPGTTLKRWGIS
jgi:hypothetical protein